MEHLNKEFEPWSSESVVEEANPRLVRNVLLCGNKSRNGYVIPESSFKRGAQALYEGKPVFIDHSENPINRRVRDLVGHVQNVRMENGRPRGDIDCLETESGNLLLSLAKKPRKGLGMSHVARYQFNKGRTQVESVEEIVSVDVVVSPATTNTFSENTNGGSVVDENTLKNLNDQIASLKADVAKLTGEAEVLRNDVKSFSEKAANAEKSLAEVSTERDQLKVKVEAHDRKLAIESELKDAKVDLANKTICSEAFLKLLDATASAEDRKALITDRLALVGESKATVVVGQGAGKTTTAPANSFESFLPPNL